MTVETIAITDHTSVDVWGEIKKNPLWVLGGAEGFTAPAWNTDTSQGTYQYMPNEKRQWVRNFYWWWRNPGENYVGLIAGVGGQNYKVTGSAPVIKTTPRDESPPRTGWKWSVSRTGFSWAALPTFFIAAYLTWLMCPSPRLWIAAILYVLWLWIFAMPALLKPWGFLPFVAYYNPTLFGSKGIEFYHGWRPASGGYGTKLILPKFVPPAA